LVLYCRGFGIEGVYSIWVSMYLNIAFQSLKGKLSSEKKNQTKPWSCTELVLYRAGVLHDKLVPSIFWWICVQMDLFDNCLNGLSQIVPLQPLEMFIAKKKS
jgi:hypothetical protein